MKVVRYAYDEHTPLGHEAGDHVEVVCDGNPRIRRANDDAYFWRVFLGRRDNASGTSGSQFWLHLTLAEAMFLAARLNNRVLALERRLKKNKTKRRKPKR